MILNCYLNGIQIFWAKSVYRVSTCRLWSVPRICYLDCIYEKVGVLYYSSGWIFWHEMCAWCFQSAFNASRLGRRDMSVSSRSVDVLYWRKGGRLGSGSFGTVSDKKRTIPKTRSHWKVVTVGVVNGCLWSSNTVLRERGRLLINSLCEHRSRINMWMMPSVLTETKHR